MPGGRWWWFGEERNIEEEEVGRRASSHCRLCLGLVLMADFESWTPVLVPKELVESVQIK